jgi:3-deoxy-manno-octulosonate cytidylyltransferase (CMP-KDO synthetase)
MSAAPPATAIIPARLASERFPNKVLAADTGRPMIVHVCEAAARAGLVGRVVVAAADREIADAVRAHGFEAILSAGEHANGSSRVAEAADRLGLAGEDLVVNVQGDEPEIEPSVIDAAIAAAGRSPAPVATVASPFGADEDPRDPNLVKAVLDPTGHALLFTRAPAPYDREGAGRVPMLRHVGLYVYRAWFLSRLASMPATPLEQAEKLEQLRFLEHGHRVAVAVAPSRRGGVDTPEQYRAFVGRWSAERQGSRA